MSCCSGELHEYNTKNMYDTITFLRELSAACLLVSHALALKINGAFPRPPGNRSLSVKGKITKEVYTN